MEYSERILQNVIAVASIIETWWLMVAGGGRENCFSLNTALKFSKLMCVFILLLQKINFLEDKWEIRLL